VNDVKTTDKRFYFGLDQLFLEESPIPLSSNQKMLMEKREGSGDTWFGFTFFVVIGSIFGTLLIVPMLLYGYKQLHKRYIKVFHIFYKV